MSPAQRLAIAAPEICARSKPPWRRRRRAGPGAAAPGMRQIGAAAPPRAGGRRPCRQALPPRPVPPPGCAWPACRGCPAGNPRAGAASASRPAVARKALRGSPANARHRFEPAGRRAMPRAVGRTRMPGAAGPGRAGPAVVRPHGAAYRRCGHMRPSCRLAGAPALRAAHIAAWRSSPPKIFGQA